jgi:hypothetical protein
MSFTATPDETTAVGLLLLLLTAFAAGFSFSRQPFLFPLAAPLPKRDWRLGLYSVVSLELGFPQAVGAVGGLVAFLLTVPRAPIDS